MRTHRKPIRRRGGLRILAASAVLVGAIGAVRFLDPAGLVDEPSPPARPAEAISIPLPLPGKEAGAVSLETQSPPTADRPLVMPAAEGTGSRPAAAVMPDQGAPDRPEPHTAAPSLLAHSAPGTPPAQGQPAATGETPAAVAESPADPRWVEHLVAKGESLARIFDQHGLEAGLLHKIVNSSRQAKSLAQIRPGQRLRLQFDENDELTRLELHRNRVESIRVAISDDGITAEEVSKDIETRIASTAGVIESSLFLDGQRAGLSDGQIMELANIFGWDIDFALEIRAGDEFRVLYEEHYLDGEKLRDGPVLAAEFTNRGTTYRALRYEDGNREVGYYDADGQSKRRAFIRTPIKFARVSSGFNPKRWHPVLKKWRSHKGVDYAAPTGTPVKATGDGRVVFRGTKNGYGKTVILEHAGKYTTLYAHLSGYSKRSQTGNRVKQGQVIGYVGMTGLASGPHLHYEFRVQGQHRDPLRVKLPKSLSLPKAEIAAFRKTTAPLLAQLEGIPTETLVASAQASSTTP